MSKDRTKEIQELVAELTLWTKFPQNGRLPDTSTFYVKFADLMVIQPYGSYDFEEDKKIIQVHHRVCRSEVIFDLDDHDPIMSEYRCDKYTCNTVWKLVDIMKANQTQLDNDFFTVLLEKPEDLETWPEKLYEKDAGKLRFTALRPLTQAEVLLGRAKRLVEVRHSVKS